MDLHTPGRVSSEQYAKLINDYARQSLGTSAFSGETYGGLADFLFRECERANQVAVDVIAHILPASLTNDGDSGHPANWPPPTRHSDSDQLEQLCRLFASQGARAPNSTVSHKARGIIFMRGHQLPGCLTRLGASFNIDPHFFNQHLEYLWRSRPLKLFASPSLPSASSGIIRLRIVTLGERPESSSVTAQSNIEVMRNTGDTTMGKYLHDVLREFILQEGHSIVRAYNVHSTQYFSIEQEITITVKPMPDGGWVILVWTDVGQELSQGPPGPWHDITSSSVHGKSLFLPNMHPFAPWATRNTNTSISPSTTRQQPTRFAQSAIRLATDYGTTLDPIMAAMDSFYSITELFRASMNSICQLLNLVEAIVDESTGYNLYKSPSQSIANLAYHIDILNRFKHILGRNIMELQNIEHNPWPNSFGNTADEALGGATKPYQMRSRTTKKLLLGDVENLLGRVDNLLERCQNGMSTCMSSASIADSERAIQQAQQMRLLTWYAFFYIPLSFTTSFFGMNILIFTSGNVELSTWFAVSAPVLLVSYMVLFMAERGWLSMTKLQNYLKPKQA